MSWRDLGFWLFIFALFFVFSGTPDLWDLAHAKVMAAMK